MICVQLSNSFFKRRITVYTIILYNLEYFMKLQEDTTLISHLREFSESRAQIKNILIMLLNQLFTSITLL